MTTQRSPTSSDLASAKELFYRAVDGDHQALLKSRQLLQDLGGKGSRDPEVAGYFGAIELLQARDAPWPWEKISLAQGGLALLDQAVHDAPGDLELRFLRGVIEYQFPRIVGRWEMAKSDLAYVARFAEAQARAGRLDPRAASTDLDYHGRVLEVEGDIAGALAVWRAAVRIDRDGPGGRDATMRLARHKAGRISARVTIPCHGQSPRTSRLPPLLHYGCRTVPAGPQLT